MHKRKILMKKSKAFAMLKLGLVIGSALIGGTVYAQTKIIPGWIWYPSAEFPSPEDACKYAISQSNDGGWQFVDAIEDNLNPSPRHKQCRATHASSGNEIYRYTTVRQASCPDPEPLYVEHIEPSELRSCNRYKIKISGPSVTKALPALNGPVNLDVTVLSSDGPVKKWAVFYVQENGNIGPTLGLTEETGSLRYMYVPPYFISTSTSIGVTCEACENTEIKTITVLPFDEMTMEEPKMCRR